MGKKGKRHIRSEPEIPFVSVCTPTFNRRPFIPAIIQCFKEQDYPSNRIEWIIYDDGTDKVEDLVKDIPNVRYFKTETKLSIGAKRNFIHKKAKGDILVYMDDDDYYPPMRISHAVKKLKEHPNALVAGSSELYIYFNELKKMYQFGPYGKNHATAGTFAIRRRFIASNKFESDACLAEEKAFLKNYTVPFVQLDPEKTILVFSHAHNTYDKRELLKEKNSYVKESDKPIDTFIHSSQQQTFYTTTIHETLKDYKEGLPEMKPDVLKQMADLKQKRKKMIEQQQQEQAQQQQEQAQQQQAEQQSQNNSTNKFVEIQGPDGKNVSLNANEVVHILKMQQKHIDDLMDTLHDANCEIEKLQMQYDIKKETTQELNKKINTEADATEANATEADATEADATEANATEADATEANATEADATEADATEANATEADATEANATES